MAKGHKPKAGSRAFWPRKRAARIYPKLKAPKNDKAVPLGFAAYKAGMTRVEVTDQRGEDSPTSGLDIIIPATVLECPPLVVSGIKLMKLTPNGWTESVAFMAEKISKNLYRKTNVAKKPTKPKLDELEKIVSEEKAEKKYDIRLLVHTQPKTAIGKKKPELFEIPMGGGLAEKIGYAKEKLGQEIKAEEIFEEGEYIDVSAVTKGKGTQGPVKRFGVKVRPRKHEKKRRHIGNIGSVGMGRVLPGAIAMPGQLGYQTRTEYNKIILKIGEGEASPKGGFVHYGAVNGPHILLRGSIPGPKKRLIILKKAQRPPEKTEKMDVKDVLLYSQQ